MPRDTHSRAAAAARRSGITAEAGEPATVFAFATVPRAPDHEDLRPSAEGEQRDDGGAGGAYGS